MSSSRIHALIPVELVGDFRSKGALCEYIEDLRREIADKKAELRTLIYMTEPGKFKDEEQSVDGYLNYKYHELVDSDDFYAPDLGMLETRLYIAEAIYETWDKSHHKNGLEYHTKFDDIEDGARTITDYLLGCNEDGVPVDYTTGEPLTKDSDQWDVNLAFNYVDQLADGTTKEQYKQHLKELDAEAERQWKLKMEELKNDKADNQ